MPERVTPVSTSTSGDYRKRVYTKFGDKGETSLLYGGRISKNNPHTEAYGITDEAVSAMGLARAMSSDDRVKELVRNLQSELFTVAAELATDPDKYDLFQQHFSPVTPEMVENLENAIDSLEQDMTMPHRVHPARRLPRIGGHGPGPLHHPHGRAPRGRHG
ncbi:Corrinoid adenosyltransferase [Geodia barretti]|uniref:Corrinoid adenosyltransferase n=1 Tax=Geodia barretti TaxID=519541 RepID=A0AA35RQT7_GEOBA|nr:Corrinoid adenosyltransferase [Geodia barretti]